MKKLSLLFFVFILGTGPAYAEDSSQVPKKQGASGQGVSETNRADKNFLVTAQPVGLGPNAGFYQAGVTLGLYLGRNTLLLIEGSGAEVGQGNHLIFEDYYTDVKTSSIGLHIKNFIGNSFYFRWGVDKRFVTYDADYTHSANTTHFEGDSVAGSVYIGNQWQFRHFTMGCDWIGYTVPFSWQVTKESDVNGSPSNLSDRKSDEDHYLKDPVWGGLRLYLGASF